MPDVRFELARMPSQPADWLYRQAVLNPLVLLRASDFDGYSQGFVRLLVLWRHRVFELSEAGWKSAKGVRRQCLRNCPPPLPLRPTGRKLHACGAQLCPWCWRRRVLRPVLGQIKSIAGKYRLLGPSPRHRLFFHRHVVEAPVTSPEAQTALADMLLAGEIRYAERLPGCRGVLGRADLLPFEAGCQVRVHCLSLWEGKEAHPGIVQLRGPGVLLRPVKGLAYRATALFGRYPALALRGRRFSAAAWAAYLNSRSGVRLYRQTGVFRTPPASSSSIAPED